MWWSELKCVKGEGEQASPQAVYLLTEACPPPPQRFLWFPLRNHSSDGAVTAHSWRKGQLDLWQVFSEILRRACLHSRPPHFHNHEFHSVVQADFWECHTENLNKLKASASAHFLFFYKFGFCCYSFTFHTLLGLYLVSVFYSFWRHELSFICKIKPMKFLFFLSERTCLAPGVILQMLPETRIRFHQWVQVYAA